MGQVKTRRVLKIKTQLVKKGMKGIKKSIYFCGKLKINLEIQPKLLL